LSRQLIAKFGSKLVRGDRAILAIENHDDLSGCLEKLRTNVREQAVLHQCRELRICRLAVEN
jgi:hypothetical protein